MERKVVKNVKKSLKEKKGKDGAVLHLNPLLACLPSSSATHCRSRLREDRGEVVHGT